MANRFELFQDAVHKYLPSDISQDERHRRVSVLDKFISEGEQAGWISNKDALMKQWSFRRGSRLMERGTIRQDMTVMLPQGTIRRTDSITYPLGILRPSHLDSWFPQTDDRSLVSILIATNLQGAEGQTDNRNRSERRFNVIITAGNAIASARLTLSDLPYPHEKPSVGLMVESTVDGYKDPGKLPSWNVIYDATLPPVLATPVGDIESAVSRHIEQVFGLPIVGKPVSDVADVARNFVHDALANTGVPDYPFVA